MTRRYLILRGSIVAGDLARLLEDAFETFTKASREQRVLAPGLTVDSIAARNAPVAVQLVDDVEIAGQYILVEADAADVADDTAVAILRHISIIPPSELFSEAHARFEECPETLLRAAYGSTQSMTADFLALLKRAAAHERPIVRRTAYYAASLTQWPQAAELLEQAILADPEPELRDFAQRTLDLLAAAVNQRKSST
jgi:hypothetical protein